MPLENKEVDYLDELFRSNEPKPFVDQIAKECLKAALYHNKKGNTCMCDFAGHINATSIQVFRGLWNEDNNTNPFMKFTFYSWDTLDYCKKALLEIKIKLYSI